MSNTAGMNWKKSKSLPIKIFVVFSHRFHPYLVSFFFHLFMNCEPFTLRNLLFKKWILFIHSNKFVCAQKYCHDLHWRAQAVCWIDDDNIHSLATMNAKKSLLIIFKWSGQWTRMNTHRRTIPETKMELSTIDDFFLCAYTWAYCSYWLILILLFIFEKLAPDSSCLLNLY